MASSSSATAPSSSANVIYRGEKWDDLAARGLKEGDLVLAHPSRRELRAAGDSIKEGCAWRSPPGGRRASTGSLAHGVVQCRCARIAAFTTKEAWWEHMLEKHPHYLHAEAIQWECENGIITACSAASTEA